MKSYEVIVVIKKSKRNSKDKITYLNIFKTYLKDVLKKKRLRERWRLREEGLEEGSAVRIDLRQLFTVQERLQDETVVHSALL